MWYPLLASSNTVSGMGSTKFSTHLRLTNLTMATSTMTKSVCSLGIAEMTLVMSSAVLHGVNKSTTILARRIAHVHNGSTLSMRSVWLTLVALIQLTSSSICLLLKSLRSRMSCSASSTVCTLLSISLPYRWFSCLGPSIIYQFVMMASSYVSRLKAWSCWAWMTGSSMQSQTIVLCLAK